MQITENIHALKIPFQLTGLTGEKIDRFVYVYLIYGKKISLIDSGVASSERVIFDYLKATGRRPEEISLLTLTHAHPDHIGAALAIQQASGCKVAAHVAEKAWIEDVNLQERERPVPGFKTLVKGNVSVDRVLGEGDIIDLDGGQSLKVLHTPGHSAGSISLLLPEEGVIISGDAIPLASSMPIYDDALTSVESIKKLKAIREIKYLLAAWDDPQRESMVYQRMDEGLQYLQRIHEAVIDIDRKNPKLGSLELCKLVLKDLGLPEAMANPLVARSFQSNLKLNDKPNLLNQA